MNRSMTWIPPRFHRLLVTSAENTLRHYHSMLKAKKVFLRPKAKKDLLNGDKKFTLTM